MTRLVHGVKWESKINDHSAFSGCCGSSSLTGMNWPRVTVQPFESSTRMPSHCLPLLVESNKIQEGSGLSVCLVFLWRVWRAFQLVGIGVNKNTARQSNTKFRRVGQRWRDQEIRLRFHRPIWLLGEGGCGTSKDLSKTKDAHFEGCRVWIETLLRFLVQFESQLYTIALHVFRVTATNPPP